MGNSWRTGSIVAGYEYRDRSALESADRAFSATSDLRPWGGSNFGSIASNPGNITRIGATPIVLAIPEGQDGTSLSESDLLPGVLNYRPFNEDNSLLPEQTSSSLFASARQEVTSELEMFVDVVATRREAAARRFQNNVTLTIPETNAYRVLNNLFLGQGAITMRYNMGEDLGPTRYDTRTDAYSIAFGGIYALANDWRIDASVSYSHNEDHAHQGNVFAGAGLLAPALASGNPATAFNPFADGGRKTNHRHFLRRAFPLGRECWRMPTKARRTRRDRY
jgi:hypothetical protein